MPTQNDCALIFEFNVGFGTDADRAARAQDCLTALVGEVDRQDRIRWAAGIPGPSPGQDIVDWINQSVLHPTRLRVQRTTIDPSPRYCVIWDGTNEIIVCYYDFALVYGSGPDTGKRFGINHQGVFVPITIRFTSPMAWGVSPTP